MKIAIGADHGGYALKKWVIKILEKSGCAVKDFGTYSSKRCDYPRVGFKVASGVASRKFERGVLICKTGLGMAMVANKVPGIRAALLSDRASARSSRKHNDANIAVFSGNRITRKKAEEILKIWLKTDFSGGRHKRRVDQIGNMEKKLRRGR